ncbi:MAG: molybdopterin synthase catalytic subunit [Actinomycetota bacterium]|jgi:molybdopterin synthase catalytic subunit|nr:molybdopterin synthase catalytic subunit [Actinomycetota bacterium]
MSVELSVAISAAPLDIAAVIGAAGTPTSGGIGVFVGTVRSTPSDDTDKQVTGLEYEAHPTLAEETLRSLALEAAHKWGLERVVALHRTGTCELGEPTVVVACSSPHRAEALDACRWLIDELKATVPIWKKEIYADGSSWVGGR